MKVLPISEVKMRLSEILTELETTREEITITRNGRPAAILVSPEEFESWAETLEVGNDVELMEEIREGLEALKETTELYTLEELFDE